MAPAVFHAESGLHAWAGLVAASFQMRWSVTTLKSPVEPRAVSLRVATSVRLAYPALAGDAARSMTTSLAADRDHDTRDRARLAGLLLLTILVTALFYYKWGGSLRSIARVHGGGALGVAPGALLDGTVVASTLVYFGRIWPALVYGILIGAAVRAAVPSTWVRRWLGAGSGRQTLLGALTGAPLMLCSCCVTPVFTGLYERGARLGPSLAVMLASPGLNLAALTLTFALLPIRVAAVRVAASLAIVLGLSTLIGRFLEKGARRGAVVDGSDGAACEVPAADERLTWGGLGLRFVKSVGYMVAVTVPLIVVGVALSAVLLPYVTNLTKGSAAVAVAVVALFAMLVALPTFFEIPIALMLLAAGAPAGVAVAFVVAGPIVNLPSLFVLARETRPRVAVALAGGVWLVATVAGLGALA